MPWKLTIPRKFWERGKGEKKKEPQVKTPEKSKLLIICEQYKRPDLYEPLLWTLLCHPRQRMLDSKIISKDLGSISLYNKKYAEAKEYFQTAMEEDPRYIPRIKPILDNFDIVAKIAIDWWTEEGMYKEVQKNEPQKTISKP